MAVSPRVIKRRIKSVANTKKITKAMELVAAAKMRKSVQMAQSSRNYSATIRELTDRVRGLVDAKSHPLLVGRSASRTAMVVIAASDRGLCGGFNAQIIKKTLEFLRQRGESDIRIVTVGRRAELAVKRAGYQIIASFEAISNAPSFERTTPIGKLAFDAFMAGDVDRVFVAYTDFKSAVTQIPIVTQLLPITPEDQLPKEQEEGEETKPTFYRKQQEEPDLLFEPNADEVLETLLPRLLEMRMYQTLLEASASEHSARMMAMRSATDNASDMLQDLTFTYNQARQASITREISEISAGKAAIE
ncbi:MAG: ATP synthase F1 subunit gamma [Patescibacteria group bacterium]